MADVATARIESTLEADATVAKSAINRDKSEIADDRSLPSLDLRLANRSNALTSDMTTQIVVGCQLQHLHPSGVGTHVNYGD